MRTVVLSVFIVAGLAVIPASLAKAAATSGDGVRCASSAPPIEERTPPSDCVFVNGVTAAAGSTARGSVWSGADGGEDPPSMTSGIRDDSGTPSVAGPALVALGLLTGLLGLIGRLAARTPKPPRLVSAHAHPRD